MSGIVRSLVFSFAVLSVTCAPSSAQNLIANPSFENVSNAFGPTTSCSADNWSTRGSCPLDYSFALSVAFPNLAHTGIASFVFGGLSGPHGSVDLSQSIAVQAGKYDFSFWYLLPVAVPGSFVASVGKNAFVIDTSSSTHGYVQFNTQVGLPNGIATVAFANGTGTWDAALDDVSLTFLGSSALTPLLSSGAPVNAVNVAGGIDSFINKFGTLPGGFNILSNFSGPQLASTLLQLDGEVSTSAERGAFELMNGFLGLMLDPFVNGRFGGGRSNFAQDQADLPSDIEMAYASVLKIPPKPLHDGQWNVWGTGFGGSNHAEGDANVGSSDTSTNAYGFASGADYHFTRDTLAGFALAGAGTNWGLARLSGGGRSDAFQVGVYGKTGFGPVYLAGAFAYTENWFTTNRVALGDQLSAKFGGDSFGGRLESGYRFVLPSSVGQFEVVPYAALQAQSFHTPNYGETDLSGGGLGLNFDATTAIDVRSEFGMRFADMTAVIGMPLILRAKLAWAHDWVSNPTLNAEFLSLPGSSFVVNGAPIPSNSALASVGAELHISTHWSAIAKFDGEFADGSQTYAATETLRYEW